HSTKAILKDDRTIPDTSEITYEFASGALMIFGMYEACGGRMIEGGEIELLGTEGNLVIDTNGYTISHSKPGQFQTRTGTDDPTTRTWPREDKNLRNTPTEGAANLIANFLDCIRTRKQPICDLETGHRSNTFSLLANIGEEVKERIEWDADKERITNITQANSLLHYEYRKPWKLG
ncbi:MAG: gfo/Idh/MocA family oxidoreductase, partial [Verrucomicrobiae bacterium]|nr:gfo/Idh/MocA family oxidoreductase [Verrucomicrobiae bacterium]